VEAKTKEAEELLKVQNHKVPLRHSIGNGRFARFMEMEKKESFVSYEESKRRKEGRAEVKSDLNK